jgi:streptogramin lyase
VAIEQHGPVAGPGNLEEQKRCAPGEPHKLDPHVRNRLRAAPSLRQRDGSVDVAVSRNLPVLTSANTPDEDVLGLRSLYFERCAAVGKRPLVEDMPFFRLTHVAEDEKQAAEYFASINRGGGRPQSFALKTAPRPTGRATRVILTEYELPRPDITQPHDVLIDREGTVWYSDFGDLFLGALDPKTGKVTEYKMPDPNAKDPHSLAFDQSGILWFTLQNSNMIGRLDPNGGDIKLVTAPTPKSRPYGIQVNSKGVPFTVLFGTNKVASIDPKTMAIKEYTLPDAGARPRRMAFTSDDVVWYSDFSRGFIGRLDPATGQVKEWQSPGGPKSEPYGISAIKDVIWYSESGTTPNTVVRFDPKTEKFQTWVIPGGGNIVRKTDVTPDGNFVLANSLVNAVSLVEIK